MKNDDKENTTEFETEYDTPDPLAPKRNGKIARLHRDIREALNRQLKENYDADDIVDWLNTLPAVKAVLDKEFNGQPINRQNLAHWRSGGYREWENHRCAYAQLQKKQKEITEKGGNPYQLGYEMAQIHAAEYLATLADLVARAPNAEVRMKGLSRAMAEFRGWRRADYHAQRMALQTERMAMDKENSQWRREHEAQELALKKQKMELDRDKFERTHIETIVRTCKNPKVRRIAQDAEKNYTQKIKEIGVIMFGDEDETEEDPESGVQGPEVNRHGEKGESGKAGVEESGSDSHQSTNNTYHSAHASGIQNPESSISFVHDSQPLTKIVQPDAAGVAGGEKAHVANQELASSKAVKSSQNSNEITEQQLESRGSLSPKDATKLVEALYLKAKKDGFRVPKPAEVAALRAYLTGKVISWYNNKKSRHETMQPPAIDPRLDTASPWHDLWKQLQ